MNRRPPRANLAKLALLTALLGMLSCAPEKQHEILTFFFDGVPPLGGSEPKTNAAKPAGPTSGFRPPVTVPVGSLHKPALDETGCGACHNRAASFDLVKPVAELCVMCHADKTRQFPQMHGPVAIGECADCHDGHRSAYPHLLLKPVPQLCFQCHDRTPPEGKTFGCPRPSDEADCMNCHDPHGGKGRFFLVSQAVKTEGGAKTPATPAPEAR